MRNGRTLRGRAIALAVLIVSTSTGWLACNPLFGIDEGNLIDDPAESGGADQTTGESSTSDSPSVPGDEKGDAGPETDADAHNDADAKGAPDVVVDGYPCGTTSCPDTLCCFTAGLSPFCWHDGDVACAIQCRNDNDCINSQFGRECCLNYANATEYGSFCHTGGCDVHMCLAPGDCTGNAPCTTRSCEGGTAQFNVCGDASSAPLCK